MSHTQLLPGPTTGPKVLVLDIETSPVLGHVWSIWEQNVGLNQIKADWHVLAWAAKWLGSPVSETMYRDQSGRRDMENDATMLRSIWRLMDEADVIITQNGINFDIPKLHARFILNGMKPPSPSKHIDTKRLASRKFRFTSNKLEYLSDKLNTKYKKLRHSKFDGFELWKECLADNPAAWREMRKYNIHDVLALEELYFRLAPWDSSIRFDWWRPAAEPRCNCGSTDLSKRGYAYTAAGQYQRYNCDDCGAWVRGRVNLFSVDKKRSLKANAP